MAKARRRLRVGLLMLGGSGLIVGFVWFFGGRSSVSGSYESLIRESVQGLEVGAAVKYRGVTLGRVNELGLVTAEYGNHASPAQIDWQTYRQVFVRFEMDAAQSRADARHR